MTAFVTGGSGFIGGRFAYWVSSQECTIDISKARRELGYRPVKGRAEGLAELAAAYQ